METIKKVVIIGPESTGKSTLCSQLAEHYKTEWVPEYAREYLLKHGTNYFYDDLLTVAKGQIDLEDKAIREAQDSTYRLPGEKPKEVHITDYRYHIENPGRILFIDTNMYVMKVWCEYVFNRCHTWILNRIAERNYDCYLLCNPDLDWVEDALREYPDKIIREKLFNYYTDLMINQGVPWTNIRGGYDERLEKAINFIDNLFES